MSRGSLVYRIEYLSPERRPVVKTHQSEAPLAPGQMIAVDGAYLFVEWVRPGKRGDRHDAVAFCELSI